MIIEVILTLGVAVDVLVTLSPPKYVFPQIKKNTCHIFSRSSAHHIILVIVEFGFDILPDG